MAVPLKILFLEDTPSDVELMLHELRQSGFAPQWERADDYEGYLAALVDPPDVILADYNLPQFAAAEALEILQSARLDVPFLVVSGAISDAAAVDLMRAGAADYLMKDRLGRLGKAVEQALAAQRTRQEKRRAEDALRESEHRYRAISELTSDFAYSLFVEEDGTIRPEWITDAFSRIVGLADPPAIDDAWDALIHPEDRNLLREHRQRLLAGEVSQEELRIVTPGGNVRLLRDHAQPEYSPGGNYVRRIFGAAQDITEQSALEEQLRQSQKMDAIGRLAGGVAHDFNNLIGVVLGYAELLSYQLEEGDPKLTAVTEIRKAGQRASGLVRQLLTFARRKGHAPEVTELNTILEGLRSMLRRVLPEDVGLEWDLCTAPLAVRVDAGRIEQLVLNLVINARDAMPEGGILRVSTRIIRPHSRKALACLPDSNATYVLLSLADNGIGMDTETLPRVFDPFFTTKKEGTGLGLSMVYGIVQQSEGVIQVESTQGNGSTFSIYFPMAASPAVADAEPALKVPSSGVETILLVEDEAALRVSVREMLEISGYRVLEARHPQDAIELASRAAPPIDLLLTDIVMPDMHGDELARRLRQQLPQVPILFMSGYAPERFVSLLPDLSPSDLIEKPFETGELTARIRRLLSSPG